MLAFIWYPITDYDSFAPGRWVQMPNFEKSLWRLFAQNPYANSKSWEVSELEFHLDTVCSRHVMGPLKKLKPDKAAPFGSEPYMDYMCNLIGNCEKNSWSAAFDVDDTTSYRAVAGPDQKAKYMQTDMTTGCTPMQHAPEFLQCTENAFFLGLDFLGNYVDVKCFKLITNPEPGLEPKDDFYKLSTEVHMQYHVVYFHIMLFLRELSG